MKNIIITIIMLVVPFVLQAQIKEVKLQASGLTCSMCSNSIHKALEKLSFIKSVDSDVETSVFTIDFQDKATVDIQAIQKAVKKAGFSVSDFVMTIKFKDYPAKNKGKFDIANEKFYLVDIENQTLNGLVELRLLNKDFMSKKAYKKVKKKVINEEQEKGYSVTPV
jgi:copper chaperone CopZ